MTQDFSGGVHGFGKMQSSMNELRKPASKQFGALKGREDDGAKGDSEGEKVHELHEHGDGTFHTVLHDGSREEHPDHLHALAHLAHHVTEGEEHHLTHHDGIGFHSHGIHEDGEHEGTHDHENLEEVKESLGKFFDEEGQEGKDEEHQGEEEEPHPLGGI